MNVGDYVVIIERGDGSPLPRGDRYLAQTPRERELYITSDLHLAYAFSSREAAVSAGEAFVAIHCHVKLSSHVKQVALV